MSSHDVVVFTVFKGVVFTVQCEAYTNVLVLDVYVHRRGLFEQLMFICHVECKPKTEYNVEDA